MKFIFIFTNLIAFIFLTIYHLHMFQLNGYSIIEEKRFLKDNAYPIIGRVLGIFFSIILFLLSFLFLRQKIVLIISIILNIFEILGNKPSKDTKIPFKYTNRVIRIMSTIFIIYGVILLISVFFFRKYLVLILGITCIIVPYIMILSNYINRPIEKMINNSYISEATDKISNMTNLIVIGITGSYGKTSMKNILGTLLSESYNVLITPHNYNTTLGVVITIREYLSPLHNLFVCEMGAKGLGQIKEICDIVHPRYGVLTSVGPMHLESFGSIENIEKTKFELINSLGESGTAFLNYDNTIIKHHENIDCSVVTYGVDEEKADFVPYGIRTTSNGSTFHLKFPNDEKIYNFSTKLLGKHNVLNIAGGIAVAYNLGVSAETLQKRVKLLVPPKHRLEIKKASYGIMIDDAYNSNPEGAKAALEVLGEFDMCKILVTPGMVELGEKQDQLNYEFGLHASEICDYIILVGKNQTKPIAKAINSTNFNKNRLYIVNSVNEAFSLCESIKSENEKIALFENDLPDNY